MLTSLKRNVAPALIYAVVLGMLPLSASASTFKLEEATIASIDQALDSGTLTSQQLVQLYLNRINAYDTPSGLNLNSFISVNPNALAQAAALDQERKVSGSRGPLFGVPILLKDNIDTNFLPTTAGFLGLAGSIPPDNATITQKLIDAGAIILGKGAMTEFANYLTTGMPAGYSSLNGYTLNPYNPVLLPNGDGRPLLTPSGSSAGPGAATAANLVTIAIGTETSGSILSPSNANSLVGIKPTVGLWSRDGIIPIASSQDTAGPMGRTVADVATLLGALTGVDPADPTTAGSAGHFYTDYTQFLNKDALKGVKLGYYTKPTNAEQLAIFNTAIAKIQDLGATVDFYNFTPPTNSSTVLSYEFKRDLNAYLASLGPTATIKSLDDVDQYIKNYLLAHPDPNHTGPFKYGETNVTASLAKDLSPGSPDTIKYLNDRALDIENSRTLGIDKFISDHSLDAIIYPGSSGAGIGAKAGYPTIIVPAGYQASNSAPFGISFLAGAYSEPKLIGYAYAFEQATLARRAPTSTPALAGETIVTVPEPSNTGGIVILGLGAFGLQRYRQRQLTK